MIPFIAFREKEFSSVEEEMNLLGEQVYFGVVPENQSPEGSSLWKHKVKLVPPQNLFPGYEFDRIAWLSPSNDTSVKELWKQEFGPVHKISKCLFAPVRTATQRAVKILDMKDFIDPYFSTLEEASFQLRLTRRKGTEVEYLSFPLGEGQGRFLIFIDE